jgi:hypothetical protein
MMPVQRRAWLISENVTALRGLSELPLFSEAEHSALFWNRLSQAI